MSGVEIAIIAGAVIAAGAASYAGVQQSEAADAQAKNAKRQARWEQMRAGAAAERQKQADQLKASQTRARLAASGRDPGADTPLQIMANDAAFADADYRSILQGGEIVSNNLRFQSQMYRQQGQDALIGGGLQAASSLASGAGQAKQARDMQKAYTANSGPPPPPRNAAGNWDWGFAYGGVYDARRN